MILPAVSRPAPLRDLLRHLALSGLYCARWTPRIHDEWMNALLVRRPDLTGEQWEWTRDQMNLAMEDCLVAGYEHLEESLNLPDADVRHLTAAAILCQPGTIVIYNHKDFPDALLAPYRISLQHPDQFLEHAFDLDPAAVCKTLRDHRTALKNPPRTVEELFDIYLE